MNRLPFSGRTLAIVLAVLVIVAGGVTFVVTQGSSSSSPTNRSAPIPTTSGTSHPSAAAGSLRCPAGAKNSTVTSWVGNTYGGANDTWIQPGIQGLWVAKDGTAYGESIFNEGARELRGYRDGKPFGGYTFQHAADLPNGGVAVTGDAKYVYAAVRFGSNSGVMRYNAADLTPAPFSGGADPEGAVLNVNPTYEFLTALTAANGKLYVADPNHYDPQDSTNGSDATVIRVYDTSHLDRGQVSSFPAPRARGLAVDGAGGIWVLEQGDATHPPAVVRYDSSGRPTGQKITGITGPTAITIDTSAPGGGHLLVTDDGRDQDIKIYGNLDSKPSMVGTFGVKGGVNAGPVPGVVGPRRLNGPAAVATDGAGNIYVVSDGTPSFAVQGYGIGENLQSYRPSGALRWQVYSEKYDSAATGIDASTGVDIYNAFDHFRIDVRKPVGEQWTRVGWTVDKYKYPYDPRINGQGEGLKPVNPIVRTLDGHKFLFMGNGRVDALNIFRFEPPAETAIPSGSLDIHQGQGSPTPGEFIWRDVNGDGDPYGNVKKEYVHPADETDADVTGWWVDDAGNVWQTTTSHGLREFQFGGLDSVGNPIYDYKHLRTFPTPKPFVDPRRLIYDSSTDTLIVSGYTAADPAPATNNRDYKFAGSTLAVYDNFTRHPTAAPVWARSIPYNPGPSDASHKTITLAASGDYIFVGYFTDESNHLNTDIHVFSKQSGAPVDVISPGPEVGGRSGNTDMEDGTFAYQTSGGGYLILNEDDGFAKTLMYEWCPPS